MKLQKLYFFCLLSLFFVACKSKHEKLAGQHGKKISVMRYDRLLNEYVRFNSLSALQKMNNTENMQATKLLVEDVLAIGNMEDDNINQKLKTFYSDTTLIRLMADVESHFPDLSIIETNLTKGFGKLKREIPEMNIPRIYSQISAFNESIVVSDTLVGISLDKYMGKNYALYKRYYYDYQCRSMSPERIVPDCFLFYLLSTYPLPLDIERSLLNVMLHYGKICYVVNQILDSKFSPESFLGYSISEKKWCKTNKEKIWAFMLTNGQLGKTDPMLIRIYLKQAPFNSFFGEESPSFLGTWMGMQIVASYMERNKKITLHDLLMTTDYNYILSESEYAI